VLPTSASARRRRDGTTVDRRLITRILDCRARCRSCRHTPSAPRSSLAGTHSPEKPCQLMSNDASVSGNEATVYPSLDRTWPDTILPALSPRLWPSSQLRTPDELRARTKVGGEGATYSTVRFAEPARNQRSNPAPQGVPGKSGSQGYTRTSRPLQPALLEFTISRDHPPNTQVAGVGEDASPTGGRPTSPGTDLREV